MIYDDNDNSLNQHQILSLLLSLLANVLHPTINHPQIHHKPMLETIPDWSVYVRFPAWFWWYHDLITYGNVCNQMVLPGLVLVIWWYQDRVYIKLSYLAMIRDDDIGPKFLLISHHHGSIIKVWGYGADRHLFGYGGSVSVRGRRFYHGSPIPCSPFIPFSGV